MGFHRYRRNKRIPETRVESCNECRSNTELPYEMFRLRCQQNGKEVSVLKVRIKFRKYGVMRFIGHLDVMRYFQKAIRRAEIPIAFTIGTARI